MAQSTRGKKHICHHCGTKFYDLGKHDVTCPKCHSAIVANDDIPGIMIDDGINEVIAQPSVDNILADGEIDTIDTIDIADDDDTNDEIASLGELEDRQTGTLSSPNDDVEAQELIEELQDYSTLVDDASDAEKELTA